MDGMMAIRYFAVRGAVLGLATAMMGGPALASPGSGITATNLATGDLEGVVNYNHDRIKFQTKDPVDVQMQRLDFAPGSYTGWHHHPGIVIVNVASGLITAVDHNCQTKTYGPGSTNGSVFVEGHEAPAEVRSADGAILYATYVAPSSSPPVFRIEDAAQSCSTVPAFRNVPGK